MNWNKEQTQELINLFEQCPELYNSMTPDFLNRIKKNDALISIANNLQEMRPGITTDIVKAKLKTIRSQYIKEKNSIALSRKSGAGAADVYVPKLWCYEQLQFLDRYLRSTPSYSNIPQLYNSSSMDETDEERDVDDHESYSQSPIIRKRKSIGVEHQLSRSLKVAEEIADSMLTIKKTKEAFKRTPQYNLGKMVEMDLSDLPDELFHEAKWKIMDIIQEVQRKKLFMGENVMQGNGSTPVPAYVSSPAQKLPLINMCEGLKVQSMLPPVTIPT